MSKNLELDPLATPNQLPPEQRAAIGHQVLISAGHFYDSDDQFIGRSLDGEHRVIVSSSPEGGVPQNEAVGVGPDVEAALHNSLEKMRTLETVSTRSLAHIEMTDSAFASFTKLEHYNPKVAPSREAYPIPSHLETFMTDSGEGNHTYRNTTSKEGWQIEVRSVLADYIDQDPAGQQLAASLKIRSLSHLTPEQAVKLSAAFVQNVSKYSHSDAGSQGLTRADQSTTMDLLREGIANKRDPNWKGNGVCRNVASNVKVVFEALKETQTDLSMLNNTYCVYGAGFDGEGYADARADNNTTRLDGRGGHAWNTFVTIGSEGSATSTIIDATWALDKDPSSAMEHLDRTEVRSVAQIMQLFDKSEVKSEAFLGLTDYVQRLNRGRLTGQAEHKGIREYATTEYLKVVAQLPEIPEGVTLPDSIASSAYRMRSKLDRAEVAALFALDKAGGGLEQERIKAIIADYDSKRDVSIPEWKSAENLVFADEDLQQLAFEVVGDARVMKLAEVEGRFRARLREVRPDALPLFNAAERPADARELSHFARLNNIQDRDPKMIMRQFNNRLKKLAANEDVYQAIVIGRSDYDLAKNFSSISRALRSKSQ